LTATVLGAAAALENMEECVGKKLREALSDARNQYCVLPIDAGEQLVVLARKND
jgi:hypothetical protein